MKSTILSHSVEVITLVFFAYSNQILAGIFKRICLDSLSPNNEHKNSLFPLTKSICFIIIFTNFQFLSVDKWEIYNDKNQGRYLHGGKALVTMTSARSSLSHQDLLCLPFCFIFWLISPFEIMDVSKFKDGQFIKPHFYWAGLVL